MKIGVNTGDYKFTTLEASVSMLDLYGLGLPGATHGIVRGYDLLKDFSVELSRASSLYMSEISAWGVQAGFIGGQLHPFGGLS